MAKRKRKSPPVPAPDAVSLENLPDPADERTGFEPDADPRSLLRTDPLDAAHAWLVLLPALALAWPWPSLLAHDPVNAATAAGWTLLLALPAGALAVVRGRVRWHVALAPLAFLWWRAAFTENWRSQIDLFEASRAYVGLVGFLTVFVSATALGPVGRRTLGRGAAVVAVLLLLGWLTDLTRALVHEDTTFRQALAGFDLRSTLGNPGDLAEALVPAGLAALAVAVGARGGRRATLVTVAALAAFAVTWSGSRAGALVAVAGGLALVALRPGRRRSLAPVAATLLAVGLALVGRAGLETLGTGPSAAPPTPGPTAITPGEPTREVAGQDGSDPEPVLAEGGLRFRQLTWARVPDLWLTAPWVGVGAGQFRRAFPPHRDPVEIELSSHGRTEPTPVDVEHPHSDPLLAAAEYGALGGVGFFLFLVWVASCAVQQLMRGDRDRRGAALGVLGALLLGLQNCGLFYGLVAPGLWMALAGAVAAGADEGARPRRADRVLLSVVLVLAALSSAAAVNLIGHGRALAGLRHAVVPGTDRLDPAATREVVDRALAFAPDSPTALARQATLQTGEQKRATLERLLALRPYQRATLIDLGNQLARERRFAEAILRYEEALALDPENPLATIGRARATLDLARSAELPAALERLEALGHATPARLRSWGANQLLHGRPALAELVLTRVDPGWTTSDPNVCWIQSRAAADRNDPVLADAFRVGAQLGFARNHAAGSLWNDAVRSYRQALRDTRDRPALGFAEGAPLIRAELAAALWRTGRTGEAEEAFEGVVLGPTDREEHLAPWAEALLVEIGFLPAR